MTKINEINIQIKKLQYELDDNKEQLRIEKQNKNNEIQKY